MEILRPIVGRVLPGVLAGLAFGFVFLIVIGGTRP